MMFGRIDNINRALKFLKLFYDVKPTRRTYTLRQISNVLGTSNGNARQWIDAAGLEIPLTDVGYDKHHTRKGPPGKVYGLVE